MVGVYRKGLVYLFMVVICIFSLPACTASNEELTTPKAESPVQAAKFEVASLKVTPKWLFVGDIATVNASVANTGEIGGVYKAAFTVDGQKTSEQEITIAKGQTKGVFFPITSTSPAVKSVAIGDVKSEVHFFTAQQPYTIQYDSYEMQSSTPTLVYFAEEPNGQIVRFTATAKPFRINKIQVAAMASLPQNRQFTINIWDSNRKRLWTKDFPWQLFQNFNAVWQDLEVPNIPVGDEFYVELISHTPAGQGDFLALGKASWFGIGFNKGDYETRSSWSYEGKPWRDSREVVRNINYCIRVQGEGSPLRVLYFDDAGADMYKASSDFSHIVSFAAPSYPFDLRLIQVYAYRDIMETGNQTFTVKVIDKTAGTVMWQNKMPLSEIAYSGTKIGNWVEIDTGGVTCNHDFFIELTTNNGNDGPIWLGCDTTAKNSNSDMAIDDIVITWRNWTDASGANVKNYTKDTTKWMIRAVGMTK